MGDMSEEEIIRYVYINLGQKMDFDLHYTFGNKQERTKILRRSSSEEALDKAMEDHTIICKSLSYILERILTEFGTSIRTVTAENGIHVYNIVKLKNGREYILDLEDDLEYIQSGAKTQAFGLPLDENKQKDDKENMIDDDTLRKIDTEKIKYIPEGYYLEDIAWMLKKAIEPGSAEFDTRLDLLLKNLEVYRDIRNVGYRERIRYHNRLMEMVLEPKDFRKIHQVDCYRVEDGEKNFQSCLVVDMPKDKRKAFLFSYEHNCYEEISMEKLAEEVKNGLNAKGGHIPGLKNYLKEDQDAR